MSLPSTNTQIVLRERPIGSIDPGLGSGTFESKATPLDASSLAAGQVLVKVLYCSLDPAMRGWLRDARSYLPPVQIGEVMRSAGLGVVVASNDAVFQAGDFVYGITGWQEFAALPGKELQKLDMSIPGVELLDWIGPLGSSGQTAYWGLMDVGELKGNGQTVVITGAAGSVGTIACQIAKLKGAKVIAVAGGAEKCDWLKSELGVDEALDYKEENFQKKFREVVCKKYGYIDIMFDNVGGDILDMSLLCLKPKAHVVLCGSISDYNNTDVKGLRNYQSLIAMKARMQGFIVFEYAKRYPEAANDIVGWMNEGKIKRNFHVVKGGVQGCPQALIDLFAGKNKGKMVADIAWQ
ncbi:NAD(P)-binding protein [Tilletiaria anomala UBC 951]|uniref:NAD(P)-binding protein n=1 Tax=Tilletiaria anomala (strain ATCC 24038 / CBS 436.72 / UBC 951) TaxID=1037660 RepID=A0A066W3Z0_TILAU|nr:NAD(P)-binding protein [Tilletiaria anomala UBC 951]KDN48426.1 NAD(P)-binding protein [Tilletiaria anomala UBC 951]